MCVIRPAVPSDVPEILAMIVELAEYERARSSAVATADQLEQALFGEHPAVFAHIAESSDGAVAGMAIWFLNFSTWTGTHGIYLEDLYVRPHLRGGGLGTLLLAELAKICVDRGYHRLQWWVLNWNEPSIGFYRSIGAVPQDEWTVQRMTSPALEALAERAMPAGA